jgi:peptide/nickel transport system substrate-binding protein
MHSATLTQKLRDRLPKAEKGGRFRPLIALSKADTVCTGCKQRTVQPWLDPRQTTTRRHWYRSSNLIPQHQSSVTQGGRTTMASRSVRLSVILLVSLLVAGTLFLAACGSGSKNTGTSGSSKTTGTANGPRYGGTLRIAALSIGGNIGWPATINGGGDLVQSYYETLLRSDQNGNLTGWLAQSYELATDNKSITFHIRKGVKFTDGSDLTADVVKWNLQQFASQEMSWGSIDVVDPYTVRVNFKKWDNSLPASFGDNEPALYMVSKAAFDKYGKAYLTSHPVGTGAFTVASFKMDASMKLVKNPNYWATDQGRKLPYLNEIDYAFTADPGTKLMMAKAGQVDMVAAVFPGKQLMDYGQLGWHTNARYDANEVWVPDSANQDSPWSKLEVREAAEYAVDRATIAKQFGYTYLQAPNQIPPRDSQAYQNPYPLARNYDPAKAKLNRAGFPGGSNS